MPGIGRRGGRFDENPRWRRGRERGGQGEDDEVARVRGRGVRVGGRVVGLAPLDDERGWRGEIRRGMAPSGKGSAGAAHPDPCMGWCSSGTTSHSGDSPRYHGVCMHTTSHGNGGNDEVPHEVER